MKSTCKAPQRGWQNTALTPLPVLEEQQQRQEESQQLREQ
jgi:hypothetical protein